MLSVEHITTGYGKKQVLTEISFEVGAREIVLLTGGNGSGKSTVLKTIYGLLKPWTPEGRIIFNDEDITALPTEAMIRCGIVYMPQKKNVFEDFTIEENFLTSASIYSKVEAKQRLEHVFDELPRLDELRKRTPFHLSGGERQLLAFGCALVHNPRMLLLDEPFAGVDAENITTFLNIIKKLNSYDMTFVVVEHKTNHFSSFPNMREVRLELGVIKK